MPMRRMIIVGVAVAVAVPAVIFGVFAAGRPRPACGCSVAPDVRRPANDAVVRFEAAVRKADVTGAWALLSDAARARYGDTAGFRPVAERLGEALRREDRAGGWVVVDERVRYDGPSEAVIVRSTTGSPQPGWPLVVLVPLGHPGDERIDPEPAPLRLTAVGDGDGVRVELQDGDLDRTTFVVIDGDGRAARPGREHVSAQVDRLIWKARVRGPVTVVAVERPAAGLRVGVAAAGAG
jgi:hypothetical protein